MPYGTMRPIWSLMYEWWIYMVFGGLYFLRSNVVLAFPLIIAGAYYTFQVNARGEAGHLWCLWALGGICAYMQQKNIEWLFKIYGYLLIFLLLITAGWLYFIFKNAYFLPAGFFLCMSIFIIVNIEEHHH